MTIKDRLSRIRESARRQRLFWGVLVLSSVVFLPSHALAIEPIIVGANLGAYSPPVGAECDIHVPSQYATIQAGINASSPGDTICVGSGTYDENVVINKPLTLAGRGASASVINGQADPDVATVWIQGDGAADNTTVEGFRILGYDPAASRYQAALNIGPFATGVTIQHNWLVAGDGGMVIRGDSVQNTELFYNNVFEGKNSLELVGIAGVQGWSYNVDFLNNTFIGTVATPGPDTGNVLGGFSTASLVQRNAFNSTGTISTLIGCPLNYNTITENNFNSETLDPIQKLHCAGPINAENNWWGDTDPSDNIWGDISLIDYLPYALSPFPEYPIDSSPPAITAAIAGTLGSNNWYTSNVSVSWTVTDPESTVTSSTDCGPQAVTADTGGLTFTCSATSAGGTAFTSVTVKRDATNPTVTYSGNTGTYAVDQAVSITCTPADTLSGIASSTCSNISEPAYNFTLGTHTYNTTATDRAGNTGNGTTSFTVVVTSASLGNLITQFFGSDTAGANGLIAKANAIASAPNANAKAGRLKAFNNQVDAKTGKPLTPAQAAMLKQFAAGL